MRNVRTLIDTGPIVASLNQRDPSHSVCSAAFQEVGPQALTCWPVITEAVYLLGNWSPSTVKLLDLLRTRTIEILPIRLSDLDGIETILAKYADQNFQLADATLMYLVEREKIDQILTLDRRDFGLFRTWSGQALTLLP
jgi:hypothetical protein